MSSKVIDGFLALNTACIHPQTNKPYIKVIGGRELGPEGGMQVSVVPPQPQEIWSTGSPTLC